MLKFKQNITFLNKAFRVFRQNKGFKFQVEQLADVL